MTAAAVPHGPMVTPPRIWAAMGVLLVLAIALLLILFQWNWLRGPLARLLSDKLDRPVAIFGNLEVHPWSWSPTATVNGVVVGNPPWAGRTPMASLPRLRVKMKLAPLLLHGKLVFPWVEADRPDFTLLRDADGRANWRFGPGGGAHAPRMPVIDHLVIGGGKVRYNDATRRLRFTGVLTSSEQAAGEANGTFHFVGQGTLRNAPFTLTASGGPLVNIDTNRPYPFVARITSGPNRIGMSASFAHPFDFNRISGRIHASGPDLAGLYGLTNVSLPNTPPYNLASGFARVHKYYAFRHIHGRVGDSDLAGSLSVDDTRKRP
ncbi:MAG TPA: AsmA family protein, partial [Caulobacteraceae bacterium]